MWISKKKFNATIDSYVETLRELEEEHEKDINELDYEFDVMEQKLTKDRDEWRAKYELLSLTPEVKADTEAAFKRGESMALNKFRAWFLDTARNLQTVLEETRNVD
jgi:DNA-binding transcriptional regulator GbsR (MarR family)